MERRHGTESHSDTSSASGMMQMFFFTATNTSLYSTSWTPSSSGAYAGTCIFLLLLAVTFRSLMAGKQLLEQRWAAMARNRKFVVVQGRQPKSEQVESDPSSKFGSFVSANGTEERVKYVQADGRRALPFRLTVDLPRALLVTLIAGVGYLLMLAVMTYNVGYFLSILAGTFLGEVAVGRYVSMDEH